MSRIGLVRLTLAVSLVAAASVALAAPSKTPDPFANLELRNLGPSVAGGRVTTVNGLPGQPGIYYVGTAGGGLWKTSDDGMNWTELFQHSPTGSIGAVAIAPSNPNDLWLGTGEANVRNDTLLGRGIFFSPDGGKTWQAKGLADAGQIAKIVVNPTNPDIIYVAVLGDPWKPTTTRGVYMTTDGGKSWNRMLFVDDTTGASAIVMDPANPNVMFAGMWTEQRRPWTQINGSTKGGIWRSLDGGHTWSKLKGGLPTSDPTDRVALAVAPSDPNQVYAVMATKSCILWGSSDMGDSWSCVSNNHALSVRPFYFSRIVVAPDNADTLYFASFQLMKSTDGGKTAKAIDDDVHVDHHAIWVDPKDPQRIAQGNDGGVYESLNGGGSWRYFDNLPIGQFYTVAISNTQPFGVCGGLQDNDGACGPSNSLDYAGIWGADWWDPIGGDGIYIVPAPSDPSIVYADSEDGYAVRIDKRTMTSTSIRPTLASVSDTPTSKLQYRFNWGSPIAVSPTDPNTVYMGSDVVFKSTDGGANWKPISKDLTRNDKSHQPVAGGPVMNDISGAETSDTILSLAIAPTDPKVIWAGTDDGFVWVTKDDGQHWSNVTPGLPSSVKYGRTYQIGVSPFDAGTAYITVDGHMLGDDHPYVFRTANYGAGWSGIAGGLPDNYSAMVVREDPNQKGLLALGTMRGLYLSFDDGGHWTPMSANLPTMPVFDLKFSKSPHDLVLATHGRGLWILDNLQAIEQWSPDVAKSDFHLFAASPGIEWVGYFGRHIGPAPTDFVADNPPNGPELAYYLQSALTKGAPAKAAASGSSPVTIKVSDSAGNHVATLHGDGKAGINRIAWNMRYDGAKLPKFLQGQSFFGGSGPSGPLALPGTYKISLSAGKQSATATVTVASDPRLHVSTQAQRSLLQTGLELRNDVNALVQVLDRIHTMVGILGDVSDATAKAKKGSAQAQLNAAAGKLKMQLGGFAMKLYNPDVQFSVPEDTLHYVARFGMKVFGLYQNLSFVGPNQTLNAHQRREIAAAQAELNGYLAKFNGPLHKAVVQFNGEAYKAGQQTLPVGKPIRIKPVKIPAS
ncbi:MAG TPA: hypothetical protein VFX38_03785 [Gammaproteobacteria bacterium]|nr:hypothetical protein [Gammaproteobacteria bacterium]